MVSCVAAACHGDSDAGPYPCQPILCHVAEMGIKVAPGDNSHGVASVGACWGEGMAALTAGGVPLIWTRPAGYNTLLLAKERYYVRRYCTEIGCQAQG